MIRDMVPCAHAHEWPTRCFHVVPTKISGDQAHKCQACEKIQAGQAQTLKPKP